jgi:AcrR family transcriptional regulator
MARPKSEDKRNGLMTAATRVIAAQGLGAPTALIAREAGVSNGSLFTYFETKTDLFNQLFLELKTDMAVASLAGRAAGAPLREQFRRLWDNWMNWATANPDKRRALALLSVSGEITGPTEAAAQQAMTEIAEMVWRARARGPLRDAPPGFAEAAMNSLAEATMDFIVSDPARSGEYSDAGFGALCRLLAGPMLGELFFNPEND